MKPLISLVIVDLDNTLYDWVTFFVNAFYDMIAVASNLINVDEETLLDDMRKVHQKYHNSEQPFGLLEARCVLEKFGHLSPQERADELAEAFRAFNISRKKSLKLYPTVIETLTYIKRFCPIVGHTEASAANAVYRLSNLQLDELVTPLYAPREKGPGHPNPERAKYYEELVAKVRLLAEHERKPEIRVLMDICRDQRVTSAQTLYIGDSISRDIGMAKSAGVWAAWAKYGTSYDPSLWKKLVRVTHWTPEDVERANQAQARFGGTQPDVVLEHFSQILEHFEFCRSPR